MSFIGTGMEYIQTTRKMPTGEVFKTTDVAKNLPLLKADPFVTEIVSIETGEVFFARKDGITINF